MAAFVNVPGPCIYRLPHLEASEEQRPWLVLLGMFHGILTAGNICRLELESGLPLCVGVG